MLRSFIAIKPSLQKVKATIVSFFPKPPPIDLPAVDSLVDLVSNSHNKLTSLPYLEKVAPDEPCAIAMSTSQDRANGLRECIKNRVHLLADERFAVTQDFSELLCVAISFAPSQRQPYSSGTSHHRQRHFVPSLKGASGVVGLALGSPIRNAACKALSNFSLCNDNSVSKNNERSLLRRQATFDQSLHHAQELLQDARLTAKRQTVHHFDS